MSRKIVIAKSIEPQYEEQIHSIALGWELVHGNDREFLLSHLKDAEVVGGWHPLVTEQCFGKEAKLKWVQSWGAGVDGYPFDLFVQKGAILTCARGVHPFPISESVFAMMLALNRKLHLSIRNQLQRKWVRVEGGEMHGKTIGIVGAGAVGAEIAKLAKAFGMRVLGIRRSNSPVEHVDTLYPSSELNVLLAECDYIVNCLPLTHETTKMFGQQQFKIMKQTAFYFSIGRGGTTDTIALYNALRLGSIAGAGIDVTEPEPLPSEHPMWELDNVLITAHNANATIHYEERAMDIFMRNLREYVKGKEPSLNRVDLVIGY
jgi:phosphoglycerate dehydrogenase-like enzyme